MVQADLDDEASLAKAFAGAHGVYGVTNYWQLFSVDKEQQQATNIARAAKTANVQHVIWSTLEDTLKWVPLSKGTDEMPILQDKYRVPHFDSKGGVDHVFSDLGLPVTFLLTSFYWDNFYLFGMGPKKDPGRLVQSDIPNRQRQNAGHRGRGHRQVRLRYFQEGQRVHRQDGSALRAST